jgi:hypothetical protein
MTHIRWGKRVFVCVCARHLHYRNKNEISYITIAARSTNCNQK